MSRRVPLSWIVFLVLVAVIVAAILLTSPAGPATAPSSPEDVEATPREGTYQNMLRTGPNAIFVDTQLVGTNEVIVGVVAMAEPGFIVIHADDGGKPGEIIGVSDPIIEGGENVRVSIDADLEAGAVYYAMLHADANGNGAFDGEAERPVTDLEGNVILMSFEATTDANPGNSQISL